MSLSSTLAGSISFSPKSPKTLIPSKTLKSPRFLPKCSLHDHHHHGRRPSYVPSRVDDPSYVRTFDTTLRGGEQSPGATMTSGEKLAVARHLARLGVDIIEAGFPASSPDDLEAVRSIAREVGNLEDEDGYVPVICGLARCTKGDIDQSWEAVRFAKRPRIHTFIATSDIHLVHKLNKSREEVARIAREMVAYVRGLGCLDIEFSPEDAGRSDRAFLYHVLEEVIKAGATTVNIPDTGAYAGARQLEITVNGIGERAGNASLEELPVTLLEYSITSVTEGIDAIASTRVQIREDNGHTTTPVLTGETGRTFSGNGADMDIVVSSVRAYLGALNKMLGFRERSSNEPRANNGVMVNSG